MENRNEELQTLVNEQVKRNRKRFPPDFMFTLTPKEYTNLKSQNATSRSMLASP